MPRVITMIMAGWLTFPAVSYAQSDWAVVQQLPYGSRLLITLPSEVLEARFTTADDIQLVLDNRTVQRDDVRQIDRLQSRRAKGAGVGILIGLAAGQIHSHATAKTSRFVFGLSLGAVYAIIGGVVGMATMPPHAEVVYRR